MIDSFCSELPGDVLDSKQRPTSILTIQHNPVKPVAPSHATWSSTTVAFVRFPSPDAHANGIKATFHAHPAARVAKVALFHGVGAVFLEPKPSSTEPAPAPEPCCCFRSRCRRVSASSGKESESQGFDVAVLAEDHAPIAISILDRFGDHASITRPKFLRHRLKVLY